MMPGTGFVLALRWSLLRCALFLAIAAAIVIHVQRTAARAAADEEGETARRTGLVTKAQTVAAGAGKAQRIEWDKSIARIRERRGLLDLHYEFAPQAAGTPMTLRMALLHEEDLLGFLDDLAAEVQTVPRVRACAIERADEEARPAQLTAECRIDWLAPRET